MKKAFVLFTILIGFTIIVLGGVFWWAIYEIPFDRLELYQEQTQEARHQLERTFLESGSMTDLSLLSTYHLYSSDPRSFDLFIEKEVERGSLELGGGRRVYIHEDTALYALGYNHCRQLYCYQRRVSFDNIPSVLWNGLIGIEDNRFLDHHGVDPRSIMRAIVTDFRERRFAQGGSTITQQLVKNLFLTNEKTLRRKIREMIIAVIIELRYPKENILEAYFNEIPWGAFDGIKIKGIYAASLKYFGIKPQYLDEYQATILIALLKGPNFYHPLRQLERLKGRVQVVYDLLLEMGYYSTRGEEPWDEDQWKKWQKDLRARVEERLIRSVWKTLVSEQGEKMLSSYEQLSLIWSTEKLLHELNQRAPDLDWGIKVAIHSMSSEEEYYHYSKHERSLRQALFNERHQIGSLLKPIVYLEGYRLGIDLEREVSTEELTLNLVSGSWSPREVSRNLESKVTFKESLQRSLNRPTIRLAQEIGFVELEHRLVPLLPRLKRPLSEYPAQLLGAIELSLVEVVELFAKVMNEACQKGELKDGPLAWLDDPRETTLRGVVDPNLRGVRYFGKTGTSNEGWDTIFVSYDGERVTAVWVGHEGRRTKENPIRLFGSTAAYRVYQESVLWRGRRFEEFGCPETSSTRK